MIAGQPNDFAGGFPPVSRSERRLQARDRRARVVVWPKSLPAVRSAIPRRYSASPAVRAVVVAMSLALALLVGAFIGRL